MDTSSNFVFYYESQILVNYNFPLALHDRPTLYHLVPEDPRIKLILIYTIKLTDDEIEIIIICAKAICDCNDDETGNK